MPDSCGLYNPNGCTEQCQQCYEKVIAGVMEYACYGQCVVVDAYGHRHLGPGLGAPAGWTPSAGGSMAEMIADEIANINNSEQTPTSAAKRDCSDRCGTLCPDNEKCYRVLDRCKCFSKPPPNWWEPLNRLTQTTVEEQKAALVTARLDFNKRGGIPGPFKYRPKLFTQDQANSICKCNGADGCGIEAGACGGKCWWMNHLDVGTKDDPNPVPLPNQEIEWKCLANNPGPWSPLGDPLRETETEQVLKVALAKARKAANFDRTMQTAPNCCNGTACPAGYKCYRRIGTSECVCWLTMISPTMPSPPPPPNIWEPYPPPPTTALTPTSQLDCCTLGNCPNSSCWTNGVECRCSVNKPGDAGTWKPASKPTVNVDRLTQTPTPMPPMY